MKFYSKLLVIIRNNKTRVKKIIGIVSVAVGLRYGKINSIPTSLWSNSTQQVKQLDNYVEEDMQVIHTDGKVIKTGSGILIGNQEVYQRLVDDREFNLLEENIQQVILVGRDSSGTSSNVPSNIGRWEQSPSNFPTPPSGGRPSRPVYVPKYRTAPKVVDPGLGAAANPAGAGGGGGTAEFDDQCPIPKKEQSQESKTFDYDYHSNDPKNKKKSKDQCQHRILTDRIKEDKGLIRAAEKAGQNKKVQRDLNHLEEKLAKGHDNPGIHKKYLGNNVWEHRARGGGRLYTREIGDKVEILAKSGKKPPIQQ